MQVSRNMKQGGGETCELGRRIIDGEGRRLMVRSCYLAQGGAWGLEPQEAGRQRREGEDRRTAAVHRPTSRSPADNFVLCSSLFHSA